MEFAKAQLSKYGWKEGKGLGKDEAGITEAIKPKLKFDNSGIGYDGAENFTYFWWERAFDAASKNINVSKKQNDISLNASQEFDISTKKVSSKKRKNLVFNNFLKSATTLTNNGLVRRVTEEDEETTEASENQVAVNDCPLTDEELFRACGGRTAHKGARHGFKLSGKLARVEEQERKLLSMLSTDTTHTTVQEGQKRKSMHNRSREDSSCGDVRNGDEIIKHKKKRGAETLGNIEEDMAIKRKKKQKKNADVFDDPGDIVMSESNEATENSFQKQKKVMIEDDEDQHINNVAVEGRKKIKRKSKSEIEHCTETLEDIIETRKKKKKRVPSDCEEVQVNLETHKKKNKRKKNADSDGTQGDCLVLDDNVPESSLISDTDYVTVKKTKKSKKKIRREIQNNVG